MPFLRAAIDSRRDTALREIRDIINQGLIDIRINEVKIFLSKIFSENIQYCKSERKNESLLVFSAKISETKYSRTDQVKFVEDIL